VAPEVLNSTRTLPSAWVRTLATTSMPSRVPRTTPAARSWAVIRTPWSSSAPTAADHERSKLVAGYGEYTPGTVW